MVQPKKHMLPSNDMKGKDPVRSWYTTPLVLSANAPKQKMFAIDSSPSSAMMLGPVCMSWIPLGTKRGKTGGAICGMGVSSIFCFGRVLRIPCRGRFMWPFAKAVLGLRYLRINRSDKLGHPLRNPRRTALRRVEILGLHRDWWANFTALA